MSIVFFECKSFKVYIIFKLWSILDILFLCKLYSDSTTLVCLIYVQGLINVQGGKWVKIK